MILADTLSITINLLLVAHVVISLLLILVVLMQRPKQEGLGAAFGGGMTDQMFGAQTTNVLQKGTVYLGAAFLLLSLVLAILIGNKNHTAAMAVKSTPDAVEEAPLVPEVPPAAGAIKDALDQPAEPTAEPAAEPEPATEPTAEPEPAAEPEAGADAPGAASGNEEAPATDASEGDAVSPTGGASEDKPE